jgi:hypothetical protein
MKKKFIVTVREVHTQPYEVEAKNKEQAVDLVLKGHGKLMKDCSEFESMAPFDVEERTD